MNDSQLISLAMTLLVVLIGILINNFRVGDLSGRFTDLNRNLDTTRDLLRAEMASGLLSVRSESKAEFAGLRLKVNNDIADLRLEVKSDISDLRREVKADIASLRTEVKSDIAGLRSELKADLSGLRTVVEQNHQTTQASLADIDA
jgi:hypothetical protein